MGIAAADYDLFQAEILEKLKKDVDFFLTCISTNYYLIGKRFRCDVSVSEHRLREAWLFWVSDLERLLESDVDKETKELDEFKQCAFLTFWLRRHQPIKNIRIQEIGSVKYKSSYEFLQKWYSRYGNDFGAIEIGSTICLNYYASSIVHEVSNGVAEDRVVLLSSRKEYIKSFRKRKDFWVDFTTVSKHKNFSPHAITLIYEALFGIQLAPIRKRNLQSGKI